jgi:hypothetical protein
MPDFMAHPIYQPRGLGVASFLSGKQSTDGTSDALKRRTGESTHVAIGPRGESQPARSEIVATNRAPGTPTTALAITSLGAN